MRALWGRTKWLAVRAPGLFGVSVGKPRDDYDLPWYENVSCVDSGTAMRFRLLSIVVCGSRDWHQSIVADCCG
jgi:hypothetical protein